MGGQAGETDRPLAGFSIPLVRSNDTLSQFTQGGFFCTLRSVNGVVHRYPGSVHECLGPQPPPPHPPRGDRGILNQRAAKAANRSRRAHLDNLVEAASAGRSRRRAVGAVCYLYGQVSADSGSGDRIGPSKSRQWATISARLASAMAKLRYPSRNIWMRIVQSKEIVRLLRRRTGSRAPIGMGKEDGR